MQRDQRIRFLSIGKFRLGVLLVAIGVFHFITVHQAFGQTADMRMLEIERYKKFSITQTTAGEIRDMNRSNADTSIRVLELTSYSRKKDGLGKVVQRSRFQGTEVKRTCYFDPNTKLFAIRDSIWYDNHTTRQLNYYFNAGKLERAVDSNNKDVTANINQTELFYWIKSMFEDALIK